MFGIPSIYFWSAGSALFALIGMLIAHKFIKPIDVDEHQPFLDATLNIVGTLVSILLGLLVAASLNNYQTLEGDVEAESTNVSQICRLAYGLPLDKRRELWRLSLTYCDQMASDEWPEMEKGHSSTKVLATYLELLKTIVTLQPNTNGETNIQSALLTAVQSTGDLRRHRILWLHNNWKRNLMPVLIMCTLIVLVFAYLYVKRSSFILHSFLICFVATALGANLGLIMLLSSPFKGEWRIQPEGFLLNSQLIRKFADLGPEVRVH